MTPITLVITRKEHGGMEILPREWDEDTQLLNEPVELKQHDRVEVHTADTLEVEPTTMRRNLTATAYDGASLYETEKD